MDFKVTDLVKNVVLAGIGAAAVTTEKAKDVADELVKKGSLTVEQGKVLNEELKHNIKETLDNKKKKDASVEELLSAMTPDQIDALKELLNKASKQRRKSQRQKHHRMKNKRQSKKRIHRMSEREDRSRLSEIMQVLRRYRITKGITPVKVREILEELGPTYVKLGQILSIRTDLISSEYCKELQKLRSQVSPMPYDEVRAVTLRSIQKRPGGCFCINCKDTNRVCFDCAGS